MLSISQCGITIGEGGEEDGQSLSGRGAYGLSRLSSPNHLHPLIQLNASQNAAANTALFSIT
jgi:hypothetical protein